MAKKPAPDGDSTPLDRLIQNLREARDQETEMVAHLADLQARRQAAETQLADYLRTQLGPDLAAMMAESLMAPPAPSDLEDTRGMESAPAPSLAVLLPSFTIGMGYDKSRAWPMRRDAQGTPILHGYDLRPVDSTGQPILLEGIVVHSTEGRIGGSWIGELIFIRDTENVSAHYYVSKRGEIERILDPGPYRSWHAGRSLYKGRRDWNNFAVGVELHHTRGEGAYPAVQLAALAWLCRQLMQDHPSITPENIVLHRWIAVDEHDQTGRKIDPSDRDDATWRAWIAAL